MSRLYFIFKAYYSILFLRSNLFGFFLLLLSFLLPSVGFLGLVAIVATIIFVELIKMREIYLKHGFYLYNSLLVGMGVGFYFQITLSTIFVTILLAILTFLLSFALSKVFAKYYLPILSLPFALSSMLFYLASLKYTNLVSNILHRTVLFDISLPFSPFFKALGEIVFLPFNLAGLFIAIFLFFHSRILLFMAIVGFWVGVWVHAIFVPFEEALYSPYNFNFILIAMALGGFFLIANIKNYLLSLIAVALSVILIDSMEVFFNTFALPVFTMPFNIVTILMLFLLVSIGYKYYNANPKESPEHSLSAFLANYYRFLSDKIKIHLPFQGTWDVYQGFDGDWTHKGLWRWAYDFVIKKEGKSYKNDGLFLQDYYAFGKEIVAPIDGVVVDLRDDLPDNPIGIVDRVNNWGNYIIIKSNFGYFVEISHLMQNSIKVKVGDFIQIGDIIGKCGNSGYSPEPHIHIQVQKYATLGSETLSFCFVDYIQENKLIYYQTPKKNEKITATLLDKGLRLHLNFILDDCMKFKDQDSNEYKIKVQMNDLGEFYFSDGKNRLFFALDSKLFYFYRYEGNRSYLQELFKIAPKIPLIIQEVAYEDILPMELRFNKIKAAFIEFFLSFYYKLYNKKIVLYKKRLEVASENGKVGFSFYEKGFSYIEGKNFQLKRIKDKVS